MRKYRDNLFRELIVDNFAGGGGASVGIELATGRPVDIAINHDPDAIAMHKVNHPYTQHYQEDVFAIDPVKVTGGRPVGIAWFSPDCKHFSRAKGGKPVEKKIRGLSWVILKWVLSAVAPRVIFMENVPEIQTWGPLKEVDGALRPDPTREGETFKGFVAILKTGIERAHPAFSEACEFLRLDPDGADAKRLLCGLGYAVAFKELKACDYGAPTIRKRFYLIARNDGRPIVFPKPTHGKGKDGRGSATPRHYLTESHLCILRNNMDCKPMTEPFPTVTAHAGHEVQVTTYLQKIEGVQDLGNWSKVRKLLNDHVGYTIAEDEILILEINNVPYFISDIGMRMLKARELMLAQGFPPDYIIDIEQHIGKKYSEVKQIARIGNSVCPPVATALVRANCAEMAFKRPLRTVAELDRAIVSA